VRQVRPVRAPPSAGPGSPKADRYLAEGAGRTGRDAHKHYRIAYAESLEATTAVRLLKAVDGLPTEAADRHQELQDRVRRLVWGLRKGR